MKIYFWNSNELSRKLSKGLVKDYDALKHLIAYLVITGTYFSIPHVDTENVGGMDVVLVTLVSRVFESLLCIFGFMKLYKTNSSADGKHFFLRIAALSLPVSIRIYVTLFIIFAISGVVLSFSGLGSDSFISETFIWTYVVENSLVFQGVGNMLIGLFCLYWYFSSMNKHILSISMR